MPITNDLDNRGLEIIIVSDDEEEEDEEPAPNVAKRQEDEKKSKALRKRQIPPIVALELSEESSSDEDEVPIRYFVFSITSFRFDLFLFYVNQSKKTRCQGEQPNVARQRFRRSVSCDPGQRKPIATLHSEVDKRKEVL